MNTHEQLARGRVRGSSLKSIASGMLMAGAVFPAFALNTGTDLNLSAKPASGGMAGASYSRPQEPSAAVFGNRATLTQLRGTQFGLGATFLKPELTNRSPGSTG